jgi:gliding motility-associated-like protein
MKGLVAAVLQNIVIPPVSIGQPVKLTCIMPSIPLIGTGTGDATWTTHGGGQLLPADVHLLQISVTQPGYYVLKLTDPANGCSGYDSVQVLQNITPPIVIAGPDDTLSCSIHSLMLQGIALLPTPLFSWTAGVGGHISGGANTDTPTIDAPGLYIMTVTDPANGCTTKDSVVIFKDANAPSAAIAPAAVLNCITKQITLQGSANAMHPATYGWTASNGGNILSGGQSLMAVIDAPGMYQLLITDTANGCTAVASISVAQNIIPPVASISSPAPLTCVHKTDQLSCTPGSGNYTYAWLTADGNIVQGANTASPVIDAPGTYNLTVIDNGNGCKGVTMAQVIQDTVAPVVSPATPLPLTCVRKQVPLQETVLSPGSGVAATWITGNGHFVNGQNTFQPLVDASGVYQCTVMNQQNGCTTVQTITVLQDIIPPVAKDAFPAVLTCIRIRDTLDASASTGNGSLQFAWSTSNGQIVSGTGTALPVVSTAGDYTFLLTDNSNGCTATKTVVVQQDVTPPALIVTPPLSITCVRDTVVLDASGSSSGPTFTFAWTTPNGQFVSGQNTSKPLVDAPGQYILVATNLKNGCTAAASASVTTNLVKPVVDAGQPGFLSCNNPVAVLQGNSPAAGALYSWSTVNGHFTGGSQTQNLTTDQAGLYQVKVTDPINGCTATDTVSVTQVPLPGFTPSVVQPNCLHPKGSIDFSALTGGLPPFSFSFDGGQTFHTSPVGQNLAPGQYDLILKDQSGCTDAATVTLQTPDFPTLTLPAPITIASGTSITLVPSTVPAPSQIAIWQWTPADGLSCADCEQPEASPHHAITYHLKITDQLGCTATAQVDILVDRKRYIFAPNIFSPDNDGKNDHFTLYGRNVADMEYLRIYDRWGSQVWETEHVPVNDETKGWDGRVRGHDPIMGVYVWVARIHFEDGDTEVLSGDVTILR